MVVVAVVAVVLVSVWEGGGERRGVMLLQGGFEVTCSWGLLEAPWGPRWGLKGGHLKSFENSGCHLELQNTQKEPPRDPQNHPKRGQESPKTPEMANLNSKP